MALGSLFANHVTCAMQLINIHVYILLIISNTLCSGEPKFTVSTHLSGSCVQSI